MKKNSRKSVSKKVLIAVVGILFIVLLCGLFSSLLGSSYSSRSGAATSSLGSESSSANATERDGHYITFCSGSESSGSLPSPIFVSRGGSVTITFDNYPSYDGEGEKFFVGWATENKNEYEYSDITYLAGETVTIYYVDSEMILYPVFLSSNQLSGFSYRNESNKYLGISILTADGISPFHWFDITIAPGEGFSCSDMSAWIDEAIARDPTHPTVVGLVFGVFSYPDSQYEHTLVGTILFSDITSGSIVLDAVYEGETIYFKIVVDEHGITLPSDYLITK